MTSGRQQIILGGKLLDGMVAQAEAIGKELGVKAEDVISAWMADLLHHDMRDSTIRRLEGAKERIGLPAPERDQHAIEAGQEPENG